MNEKKLILITLSIILVPMFIFSETYTYYVYQNNVEMGNISVDVDPPFLYRQNHNGFASWAKYSKIHCPN